MFETGDKLFIAHRRMFERDQPRYFVGAVVGYQDGLVKVTGFSFVRDLTTGNIIRKDDIRTKVVALGSGAFIAYQLPDVTDIDAARFETDEGETTLIDGRGLRLNLAENSRQGKI